MRRCIQAGHTAGMEQDDLASQLDFLFLNHRQDTGKHLPRIAGIEQNSFMAGHGVNGFPNPRFRFIVTFSDISRFDVEVTLKIKSVFFFGLRKVGL